MSQRLPLLNLPPKAKTLIIRSFELKHLLYLSLCSRRAKDLVKQHTSTFETPVELNLDMYSTVQATWGDSKSVYSAFLGTHDYLTNDIEYSELTVINGRRLRFHQMLDSFIFFLNYFVSDTPELDALLFLEYLMDVFPVFRVKTLHSAVEDDPEAFERFKSNSVLQKVNDLSIGSGRVSHQEMEMLLENNEANDLRLGCYPGRDFVFDKPLSNSNLIVSESQWFSRQNLLETSCKSLELGKSTLTSEDLNAFVIQWLDSDNTELEFLEVCKDECDLDMNVITRGLTTIPGTPKRHEASRYLHLHRYAIPPKYENGVDVRRESDGMLATIVFYSQHPDRGEIHGKRLFVFVVWHDPNPFLI